MLGEVVSKYTSPGAAGKPFRFASMRLYLTAQTAMYSPEYVSSILNTWSRLMGISVEMIMYDVVVFVKFHEPRAICAGGPKVDAGAFPAMDLVHPDEFWTEAAGLCGS